MKMVLWKGPTRQRMTKAVNEKMSLSEAMQRVDGKLPKDVAALVRLSDSMTTSTGKKATKEDLDEGSLEKARKILNGMVEASQTELDTVLVGCKEFEEKNRETFSQVTTDLARLGSALADLSRKRIEANEGITSNDADRLKVEGALSDATRERTAERLKNDAELTSRKNDLEVFNFILQMVQCEGEEEDFLQVRNATAESVQVCVGGSDGLDIKFNDPKVEAKFERLLTPSARKALRQAMGQVEIRGSSLMQRRHQDDPEEEEDVDWAPNVTTSNFPTFAVDATPVVEEPPADQQWKKCVDGKPECGLLHDTMATQWGTFKDSVDELTVKMEKDDDAFKELTANLNEQLIVLGDVKTKSMELLAETISSMNADTAEMDEKDTQHHDLEHMYKHRMAECKSKVEEILFTNICAVRKVRNALMTNSKVSPPTKISDCDVADWVAEECSMDCDDACPQADPYKCGGMQTLSREVVVTPNAFGVACPPLQMNKKCNQYKCPVDCVLSEWSGWSKCTKDCEGGIQEKTRSILTKAKHGGEACDTSTEARSCNTGSCDRDCSLETWTDWSACTAACGGGMQERVRRVLVPIRGNGKCPKATNPDRLDERQCNSMACAGDEICIAHQDVIVALDSSGSLGEKGFEALRDLAANTTGRYRGMYYGRELMQLGLAVFGNGKVRSDGTVAPALNMQELTNDTALVTMKIQETTWQKGLTNMAQMFTLAGTMLTQGGRADAQSAILVFSDGRYSFKYQSAVQAQRLKDRNVKIFMAVVSAAKDEGLKVIQAWASQPYQTNYVRIPGFAALEHNKDVFAGKLITEFCSKSISPSVQLSQEEVSDYMKIHEGGYPNGACSVLRAHGKGLSIEDCLAKAREEMENAFVFGGGECKTGYLDAEPGQWHEWQADLTAPECPHGAWEHNPYFSTYFVRPSAAAR